MRLFKRASASPPRLIRLSVLEEGGAAACSTAPAGLRLSLPSCVSECNIDELMAYTATPKSRKGFPFPWLGRKHNAPKKYAVNSSHIDDEPVPTLMRAAVSQLSLSDYSSPQWPKTNFQTFRPTPNPPSKTSSPRIHYYEEIPYHQQYPSSESLNNNINIINNNNNVMIPKGDPQNSVMYRSVSTSALFEDSAKDLFNNNNSGKSSREVLSSSSSPENGGLIDPKGGVASEGAGLGELKQKPAVVPSQQLGTVLEEEVFLDRGVPAEFDRHLPPSGDTESLASSIQHRSDESGYESDGTKNSNDDGHPIQEDESSKRNSLDTNVQKFTALFQRLAGSLESSKKENESELPCSTKVSSSKCYEARSLRLRAPAMLSNFVQKHSKDPLFQSSTPTTPVSSKSPKITSSSKSSSSEDKAMRTGPSKLGQFKAWTLDRKLLRSRWKKTALPDDKLEIPITSSRRSIFQSSLFPPPTSTEESPISHHHHQLETKSLPSLSSVSSEHLCELPPSSSDAASPSCGGLNYQIRLKKAGYKSSGATTTSSNQNARRRLWLQSQLSTSDSEDVLSPESVNSNKSFVTPPPKETPRRLPSQLDMHELVSVDLRKDEHGELGIYITGCTDSEKNVLGYIIMDLEKGGPAERSQKLHKGDELLIVNGQQLQGVGLEEARRLLRVPESEMHLLLARELSEDLCFQDDRTQLLPPVPELHESTSHGPTLMPRLRHWQSDVSAHYSKSDSANRLSNPDVPPKSGVDNERMGSNGICTLPRRPKSSQLSLHTVVFEKGTGKKSLGFSIVGGKDSPKGELGFYVKTIFANGQAAETGSLREGDELYTLNGEPLQGLSHSEAISAFKKIKQGAVVLHIGRRANKKSTPPCDSSSKLDNSNSKSCSTLDNI